MSLNKPMIALSRPVAFRRRWGMAGGVVCAVMALGAVATIAAALDPGDIDATTPWRTRVFAMGGALLTLLGSGLIFTTLRARNRALALAENMTLQLQQSERRARLVIESAHDAIVTTDAMARVVEWNPRATELFGHTAEVMLGADLIETIFAPHERDLVRQKLATEAQAVAWPRGSAAGNETIAAIGRHNAQIYIEISLTTNLTDELQLYTWFLHDVTRRHAAEVERDRSEERLSEASRRAGMAEIATGVLHNVGNVLNSVTTSATIMTERLQRSKVPNLGKTAAMIESYRIESGAFVLEDSKARKLPEYLSKLSSVMSDDQELLENELGQLCKSVEHIKQIVAAQQSFAKAGGNEEETRLAEVIEDAIRMTSLSHASHGIVVHPHIEACPPVLVEKHKVLQILINLITNAKKAVAEAKAMGGNVSVNLGVATDESPPVARIRVMDTGVGIAPDNMKKIFQHGFTTRKDGHGFGLHTAAIDAREMGGLLRVDSAGAGQGATFTLDIPLVPRRVFQT